jgi:hypothetical protein
MNSIDPYVLRANHISIETLNSDWFERDKATVMNTTIHRKQMIILALAMTLAATSCWIPLPGQPDASPGSWMRSEPIRRSAPNESIPVAREPATTRRFSISWQSAAIAVSGADVLEGGQKFILLATEGRERG